jgi:hypothetical protein
MIRTRLVASRDQVNNITITMPQMVSSVLPTA